MRKVRNLTQLDCIGAAGIACFVEHLEERSDEEHPYRIRLGSCSDALAMPAINAS